MITYVVRYPSGATFTAAGRLGKIDGPDGPVPAVDDGDKVVVLDPRAIILHRGKRIYGPRDLAPDEHSAAFRTWLIKHPEWDAR